jgi:DNA-binding transcriptional ArsR family regulator
MTDQLQHMEVEDIEVFEVLNNPLRLRILRQLVEPNPIRAVAEALNVPPTRLYYHFDLLEDAGVIRVVETRKVGAMLQKVYQTTARSFRPSAKLTEGDHSPSELAKITAGVVLDGARLDAEEALERHFEAVVGGADPKEARSSGSIGRSLAFFSKERAQEFAQKLEKMLEEEFDPDHGKDGIEFAFSYTFFPVAGALEDTE